MSFTFRAGLMTQPHEVRIQRLSVRGVVPEWLDGVLIRNGPAKFEVGDRRLRHWFDGLAMLHQFWFQGGTVSYANRYLRSQAYKHAVEHGKIALSEFATDPCRSIFRRAMTLFTRRPSDNGHVSVARLADEYIAMTETPLPTVFDPRTLETVGVYDYHERHRPGVTTAHPHFDHDHNVAINTITEFGHASTYRVLCFGRERHLIGAIPVARPAYMHSFGMTAGYIVLAEFPLVVNPLELLLSGRPFIENFRWKPERGTRFLLMSKADGRITSYDSAPFFAFHHVNAFERGDDVFVDLVAYPDSSVINAYYLSALRTTGTAPTGELRRYRLASGGRFADYEVLAPTRIELPRIDYWRCQSREYRYIYAVGTRLPHNFNDQLVKIDTLSGSAATWFEEDCYPGEPVFVLAPQARHEDDGVVLSVVLDGRSNSSFLLVLDAATFGEIGRAIVPQHIPFGFHGEFFRL
jgi:carotenoid cleavage dioxygenase-like enzyme